MGVEKYQGKTALIVCNGGFFCDDIPKDYDYLIGVNDSHLQHPHKTINLWVTDGSSKNIWKPEYADIDIWVVGQYQSYLSDQPVVEHEITKTPDYIMSGAMMRTLSEGMRGFPSPYYAAIVIAKELGMIVQYDGSIKGKDQSVYDYYAAKRIVDQWQRDGLVIAGT